MSKGFNINSEIDYAISHIRNGKVETGIDILRNILDKYPTDSKALLTLGRTLLSYKALNSKYEEEGLFCLNIIVNNNQASAKFRDGALLELGKYYRSKRKMEEAYLALYPLLKSDYCSEDAKYQLALVESFLCNVEEANNYLLSYQGKYNEPVLLEYTKNLIAMGKYIKAQKNLDRLVNSNQRNKVLTEQIYLYIKTREYQKALDILNSINPLKLGIKIENVNNVRMYLENMLGKRKLNKDTNNYLEQLLCEYEEKRAINYIVYSEKKNNNKNVNLEITTKVFDYCKGYIQDKKPIRVEFLDYYFVDTSVRYFKEAFGFINNKKTHYVKVGTLPNTKNIVSIRPVENIDEIRNKLKNNSEINKQR